MTELVYYTDENGHSQITDWLEELDRQASKRVILALDHLEAGNTGKLKSLRGGLYELRVSHGPGYRVYLGQEGDRLIILLCGGTKRQQDQDIKRARSLWAAYKAEKKTQKQED
ncbi:type II toxin-antitoxin system RelE/ParE family toxin [Jiella marina]|uniref:type II toxin-antitoxin system RelE/ParE family toxin n=1 Tax=Jiella sp. LLJ827 TaxID=2917712 RepID=UPI0021013EB6|nr:type II toxin-antitoxin system RelE/ParE family toxin [Jiella sp. LLJ827]MCQ0990625.1 type II toxin-antitoxin system RelE/ParE family toxin [Jiella sp. LLJ827]